MATSTSKARPVTVDVLLHGETVSFQCIGVMTQPYSRLLARNVFQYQLQAAYPNRSLMHYVNRDRAVVRQALIRALSKELRAEITGCRFDVIDWEGTDI